MPNSESKSPPPGGPSPRFADLHCHPTMYGFHRLRHSAVEETGVGFDPWNVPPSDERARRRGARATRYAQSDFPTLAEAGVRLVFASLTPIERGFFGEGPQHPFALEVARWVGGVTPFEIGRALARGDRSGAAHQAARILRNKGPLRRALHRTFLGFPAARVDFLMSPEYDYWEELSREYEFLVAGADRDVTLGSGHVGRYTLVRDGEHLDRVLASDDGGIAVVTTIEGGHAFSLGPRDRRVAREVLFERIEALRRWPHPILFVTLAHHFDNGLCGHARSLIDAGTLLLDQTPRMGEGFEPDGDLGFEVVRRLLGRGPDLEPTGDPAIHIDLKHFSPRSRAEYYARVVRPLADRGDLVPVIFSHAGYSGVRTLDDLVAAERSETDRWVSAGFNAWGINVCDEDIAMVHRTGGLIGLCLDRRIAGVAPGHAVPAEHHARVILRQIFGLVDAILQDDRRDPEERLSVWDCIAIGSDFDGAIHPLGQYATAASYPALAEHLRAGFHDWRHSRGIARLGVDNLVDKVLWRNAREFARRHLPGRR